MNSPFSVSRKVRIAFSKLSTLLLLFQRTPVVQMILPEARAMTTTGVGELAKWTVTVFAGLGAFDTVSGASGVRQIITASPASVKIKSGAKTTLRVVATGNYQTFQWYVGKSGDTSHPIPKAYASRYTTPSLKATTRYWVRVRNSTGSANSKTSTVTVLKTPSCQPADPFPLVDGSRFQSQFLSNQ